VDCFISLGIQGIVAESFGAIYERNAINAAFPVINCKNVSDMDLKTGDYLRVELLKGILINTTTGTSCKATPFSEVQYEIYQNGGLF